MAPLFNQPALGDPSALWWLWNSKKSTGSIVRPRDKKGTLRLPIIVNFGGTVWATDCKSSATERQSKVAHNQRNLQDAVLILSQSPTGRFLLEMMTLMGFKVVFDDEHTSNNRARGLCDMANKKIYLHSNDDIYMLALVLAHESVHACQSLHCLLQPNDSYRIDQGIRLSFAIEADAHAQQAQVALELAYGDIKRSREQVLFPEALVAMRASYPDMMRAVELRVHDHNDIQSGIAVAAAFEEFYSSASLRDYYEDRHITWACERAEEMSRRNPTMRGRFFDTLSDRMADMLTWQGKNYIQTHLPSLKFDDIRHSGFGEKTISRIHDFYEEYLPAEQRPVVRKYTPKPPSKNTKNKPKPPKI